MFRVFSTSCFNPVLGLPYFRQACGLTGRLQRSRWQVRVYSTEFLTKEAPKLPWESSLVTALNLTFAQGVQETCCGPVLKEEVLMDLAGEVSETGKQGSSDRGEGKEAAKRYTEDVEQWG